MGLSGLVVAIVAATGGTVMGSASFTLVVATGLSIGGAVTDDLVKLLERRGVVVRGFSSHGRDVFGLAVNRGSCAESAKRLPPRGVALVALSENMSMSPPVFGRRGLLNKSSSALRGVLARRSDGRLGSGVKTGGSTGVCGGVSSLSSDPSGGGTSASSPRPGA